ncbi:putative transcriptional regulator [Vibrio crassostreae]|uniref:helix-turn-helix transcriptional regulator n=1 Tax=Vibrio TaxID=662 RepID=UPI0004922374|nr:MULTISPECIES: helix-turn-helix transcriptional regulator [Vibrio]MDP2592935.1 helix-turn-helix transcriptional regulator [Vibrio splendidus]OEF66778.1 transcriptional regulator [Vibrio tasmaniensis 1F-187]TCT54871.1 DNA-binding XRE family transcriptional regulator [Vibrio crassostreae]TCT74897.1 DNA-binding XRE family transcriptional regulator [Vibrio crassostreae]CAK2172253.1 putative transcriptional regulator [Vibrio crassostreae]
MESSVLKTNRAKMLRAARERAGLTQEEIAKRIKVAKQTYLKWENGDTEPKATQIKLLAQELKISADEICNGVLFERYALDDFIMEQMVSQAPPNIVTLRTWQFIHDHQGYIESLSIKDLERRRKDLESAILNYEDLIKMGAITTEENEKIFKNAIEKEKKEIARLERE